MLKDQHFLYTGVEATFSSQVSVTVRSCSSSHAHIWLQKCLKIHQENQ